MGHGSTLKVGLVIPHLDLRSYRSRNRDSPLCRGPERRRVRFSNNEGSLTLNVERGTFELLLLFEECVFDGLHPLRRVGYFEGGGVFLILIIHKVYFD